MRIEALKELPFFVEKNLKATNLLHFCKKHQESKETFLKAKNSSKCDKVSKIFANQTEEVNFHAKTHENPENEARKPQKKQPPSPPNDQKFIEQQLQTLCFLKHLPCFEARNAIAECTALLTLHFFCELPYAACQDRIFFPKAHRLHEWVPEDPSFWLSKPAPKTLAVTLQTPAIERLGRRLEVEGRNEKGKVGFHKMCASFAAKHCTHTALKRRSHPRSRLWHLFRRS